MRELNQAIRHFDTPRDHDVSRMQRALHYSQAIRIPAATPLDRVEISGQGGWDASLAFPDDLDAEIRRAFDNVETILGEAGATWDDVVAVDSFHVSATDAAIDQAHTGPMVDQMQTRMPGHRPIWTQIGVHTLGAPRMRVEIRVTALVAPTVPAA